MRKIPHLASLSQADASAQKKEIERYGLKLPIMHVEWPNDYPYAPTTSVSLAHDGEALYIHFSSYSIGVECKAQQDGDMVYKDCCLEAFVQMPGEETYFNLEFNALGICDAAKRSGREDACHFSAEQYASITRHSSLEKGEMPDPNAPHFFTLLVRVPFRTLGLKEAPKSINANFYKCGDETVCPHYCSWMPVQTAQPDFHQPKYFKALELGS